MRWPAAAWGPRHVPVQAARSHSPRGKSRGYRRSPRALSIRRPSAEPRRHRPGTGAPAPVAILEQAMVLRMKKPLPEQALRGYTSAQQERADELQEQACRASGAILAAAQLCSSPELSHRDQIFPSAKRRGECRRCGRGPAPPPPRRRRPRPRWQHSRGRSGRSSPPDGRARPARGGERRAPHHARRPRRRDRVAPGRLAERDDAPPTTSRPASPPARPSSPPCAGRSPSCATARSSEAKRALFQPDAGEPSAARARGGPLRGRATSTPSSTPPRRRPACRPWPEAPTTPSPIHFDFASSAAHPRRPDPRRRRRGRHLRPTLTRVRLVGHTDRVGGPAANRRLAARRAARRRRLPRRRRHTARPDRDRRHAARPTSPSPPPTACPSRSTAASRSASSRSEARLKHG